jgi:hypothetical protein
LVNGRHDSACCRVWMYARVDRFGGKFHSQ